MSHRYKVFPEKRMQKTGEEMSCPATSSRSSLEAFVMIPVLWSCYLLLPENGGLCPLRAIRACSYCPVLFRSCSLPDSSSVECPSVPDLHMELRALLESGTEREGRCLLSFCHTRLLVSTRITPQTSYISANFFSKGLVQLQRRIKTEAEEILKFQQLELSP